MASVRPYKNPSGEVVWRVQFRIDGIAKQKTFYGAEAPKASTEFGELVDRVGGKAALEVLERRQDNIAAVPTLKQWTAKYLDPASGILTGIQPGTRDGYLRIAEASFLKILGEYPIDAIEKSDVGKWIDWQERQPSKRRKGETVSAKTVRNYHALLSQVLTAAVEVGKYRPDNPAYKSRMSEGRAREAVFLSRSEFARLFAEIPDYYKPLVAFLVGSQCRWSEATALERRDVSTETDPPTVRVSKAWKKAKAGTGAPVIGVPKTRRGRRTISLWPALVNLILAPDGGPGDFLFRGKISGGRIWYGAFNTRIWQPAVTRADLNPRPNIHDLRHTGASWLIADGKPLPYIQARLGHEKITTTIQVYGHLLPDAHTEMADSMERTMANVLPTAPRGAVELEAVAVPSAELDPEQ